MVTGLTLAALVILWGVARLVPRRWGSTDAPPTRPAPRWARTLPWVLIGALVVVFVVTRATR